MLRYLRFTVVPALLITTATLSAQTFAVGGSGQNAKATKGKPAGQAQAGIGFGEGLGVARLVRGAESALKHGNATQAAAYAKQATEAAPGNANTWFLYGYAARLAGRLDESVAAYYRGLKIQPNSPEGKSGLAQTEEKLGHIAVAKRLLLEVVNAHPERVNDLLIAGDLFMRTNDVQQGLSLLQRAEAKQPSAHSELLIAIAYMKLKDPARAKAMVDQVRRRYPKNTDVYRAVATLQRDEKDYAGAIATLRSAPTQKAEVLADLGYTYELAGDKAKSAATWQKAAGMQPGNIGYQLSAAAALLHANELAKVKQYLQRAQAIDPDYYRLHALKAQVARQENQPQQAIEEYVLALAKIPEAPQEGLLYPIQLRLNLSELYKSTGNDAAAKQQIALAEAAADKLKIEGPARAEFLRVRASIRSQDGDPAAMKAAEQDLQEAMKLDPNNSMIELQYANLLFREKRTDDAIKVYESVLRREPKNQYALESMGYLMRDAGKIAEAVRYFRQLAADYPDDYVPYLALGDLYTSQHQFQDALNEYDRGYALNQRNAPLIANAANAALELHKIDVAKVWIERATAEMRTDPRIMRERERYLFYKGDYLQSAQLGYAVLKALPQDRNASVYLAYDLYNMGRRDDVLAIASKYENIIPYEANFPLLEGHVHRQGQLLDQAVDDYTRAIARDKGMVEAYVNRGYVYNDLQNAEAAIADFDKALSLQPDNGVAQLGRAFSNLELRRSSAALANAERARELMGDSGAVELALATANRQLRKLPEAQTHYNAALRYAPNDITLWLALADTQYESRQYAASIRSLEEAVKLDAHDPLIYAEQAHAYAQMRDKANTRLAVQLAEKDGSDQSAVLLATGDALSILGDHEAAMQRFGRALQAPDSNRVDVRLAIARLFTAKEHWEDARQQIALGFAEARTGESAPASADNLIEAGNLFLAMHDYPLAQGFYDRARQAGAPEQSVAMGETNTYLAQGDDRRAESALASVGNPQDYLQDLDYQLALGNLYRQRRDTGRALTAFGRANLLTSNPEDWTVNDAMLQVAGERGFSLTPELSIFNDSAVAPIFEDTTIYALDAQLLSNGTTNLPPPRSSIETRITTGLNYDHAGWPKLTGFYQLRNAVGEISLPSQNRIVKRNTVDTTLNGGVQPVLRLGNERINFNGSIQFTIRRDKDDPVAIDENLFRQQLYIDTSTFFNWITLRASGFHESGPFSLQKLNSSELGGKVEFQVGRPWAKTALITGYRIDDLKFSPLIREYFTTSSYLGIQRKFGTRLTVTGLAELIRSWRVQDTAFATAQAIAPGGNVDWRVSQHWAVNAFGTYQSNKNLGVYDNVQSGFFISYTRPLHQSVNDGLGAVPVAYPIRLSFGIQQEDFMHFNGNRKMAIRPVVRLTLF